MFIEVLNEYEKIKEKDIYDVSSLRTGVKFLSPNNQ